MNRSGHPPLDYGYDGAKGKLVGWLTEALVLLGALRRDLLAINDEPWPTKDG